MFFSSCEWPQAPVGSFFKRNCFFTPANPRSHANFRKNELFKQVSSLGTYLERCALTRRVRWCAVRPQRCLGCRVGPWGKNFGPNVRYYVFVSDKKGHMNTKFSIVSDANGNNVYGNNRPLVYRHDRTQRFNDKVKKTSLMWGLYVEALGRRGR